MNREAHETFCFGYYHERAAVERYPFKAPEDPEDEISGEDRYRLALLVLEVLAGLTTEFSPRPAFVDEKAKDEIESVEESPGEECEILPLFFHGAHDMRRRPTQVQVDILTDALGHKPRWWKLTERTNRL